VISSDGAGAAAHVGARLLVEVADGLGLTEALGKRADERRQRRAEGRTTCSLDYRC